MKPVEPMADSGDHFAAFSFVDRITEFAPGKSARGIFHVPAAVRVFPACLVAEAVGQLAAWVSMEHIDYRGRPVAALAGETRFLGRVEPGDTLALAVEIDDVDDDAVSYRGWADVNGARVIELNDCLGPMLPVADFDAPESATRAFRTAARRGRAPRIASPALTRSPPRPLNTCPVARYAPNSRFPRRLVFLRTIFRAAPCFRRHCCSTRRSDLPRHWPARST